MLGVFIAIFLNLFLLFGNGGLALEADSNHSVCVDHDVNFVSTADDAYVLGHEDIAQQLQDRWSGRVDGAVDMASLLKQIASDPAMRRALYCLMKNELGARYGGANGMVNAADDLMVGSIETILTAGAAKFGGSAKFAAKLRGMANKIGKSRVGGGIAANSTPASFFGNTRWEVQALQRQGLSRSEAFQQIRSFNAGNADGYLFHFTTQKGARGILGEGVINPSARGVWGPGVYSGTTPTPDPFLKNVPFAGWGLGGKGANVRIPFQTTQPSVTPWLPPRTRVFRDSVPLEGRN